MPRPRPSRERPWVVIFILLSLLAHLVFVITLVAIGHFFPAPKLKHDSAQTPVNVTMVQDPTPPPPVPKHKRPFLPTTANTKEHKETEIESDADSRLQSKSTLARLPDSTMPDQISKEAHPNSLQSAPNAPNPTPPHPATVSSNGKEDQPSQATPQPPQPSPAPQKDPADAKEPSKFVTKNPGKNPVKAPSTQVVAQQLDAYGLPVLPQLNAPTMAPASERQAAAPASSIQEIPQDSHGGIGAHGDTSPEAMATEFGRYKAKVYRAVGGRWYPKVDKQFQVMPVGIVHIQFTVHSDGTVETKVLEGSDATLQILLSVSLNAIHEASPFDPFTPSMIREVGNSYTDDFTFSIYGGQ